MNTVELENRISILEAEMAFIKSKVVKNNQEKPWYKNIPKFGGNSAYEEAMKLGREYRESQKDFEEEK